MIHMIMGRQGFWPSVNMRVCAHYAIKARGLAPTLEIKKALRYHYQILADKGLFKSPPSWELKKKGIDVSTWNDGDGFMKSGLIKGILAELSVEDLTPQDMSEKNPGQDLDGPAPPGKVPVKQQEVIERIVKSGNKFSNTDDQKEDRPFTDRRWKGEHYNPETKVWDIIPGHRWDPWEKCWKPGVPITNEFYWDYEFMYCEEKYTNPVPYGKFHEEILMKIESVKRAIILIGRDHLKTTIFHVDRYCFHILEKPEIARAGILSISWDNGLAEATFQDVVENLTQNEKILSFYGDVIDYNRPKTQDKVYFIYQPIGAKFGLRCVSFKSGSITGTHPGMVGIDDPQDEPFSDVVMEKFKRIITKKLIPAVGKRGIIYITGTIKGHDETDDGYLWLEKKPGWQVFRYPAADSMPPMTEISFSKIQKALVDPVTGGVKMNNYGEIVYETTYEVTVKNREKYKPVYPERYQIEDLVAIWLEMMDTDKSDDAFWSEYFLMSVNPRGKFFNKTRLKQFPPPGFSSTQAFLEHLIKIGGTRCLWIDPGGATSHGIAVAVGTRWQGKFYWFDFLVLRAGIPQAAETVARLIMKWKIEKWGCEGNFLQKECFANVIDREVRRYLEENGYADYYHLPLIKNNTGDKFQRIQTSLSIMIGLDGTDITCYANQESDHYDKFRYQYLNFGSRGGNTDKQHDFDLLDCMAGTSTFLFPLTTRAIAGKR